MESWLLLDIVIREGSAIFQLLSCKDQSLLIRRNSLFILDLGFNGINSIWRLDIESDGLARKGLNKNLHFKI